MHASARRRSLLSLLPLLASPLLAAEPPQTFTVKTLPAQMKYDLTEIDVRPGAEVKLTFVNQDQMPHNMIFFQAGADAIGVCNKQMEKPDEALKRNWLPEDPNIWMHSKNLDPGAQEVLVFKAPENPGLYPYVCSMPGHAAIMNGRLRVYAPAPQLTDLKFALYLGDWKKLPDFSKLPVHREGPIADNLVQIKLDDYKNQFGLVYTGKLKAPADGEYTFALASDDGARVLIDGKNVLEYDGIHPSTDIRRSKKTKLSAGEHDFRLEYFQATGESEIFVAWEGGDFPMTPLSKWTPKNWNGKVVSKPKDENTGLPLVVNQEPVIYRNFIEGAGERGIGVGYPGGFNIAWNADYLNLALVWRGAFIDAARHWRSRGGGAQPPLGYDVCRMGGLESPPFAVLASPDAEWPKLGKEEKPEDFQWKGYSFDPKRYPIFHYEWSGAQVTERFDVTGESTTPGGRLIRTVKVEGKIPAGAFFRAAVGSTVKAEGAGFVVDSLNHLQVEAEGAQATASSVLIPARAEMKISYSWPASPGQTTTAR